MSLRSRSQALANRIDSMSLRERGIIMLMLLVILLVLWFEVFMAPLDQQRATLNQAVEQTRQRIDALNTSITQLVSDSTGQELKARKQRLQAELARINDELNTRSASLVAPAEMARLLEDMLNKTPGLTLVEMRNLPPEPLFPEELGSSVYRHGLAITVEGSYLDTLAYVQSLENLPWEFYWKRLALETQDYPQNRTTIVVYTLSLEEGLLGV
ncbi:MAG TPA: hypothetical protein VFP95_05480 [Gammaproteobacteria bacterium]|nr:hypothetical protein [Gammaproteobacteria bacterium]